MREIISTVGTSIFENFFQLDGENSRHQDISKYKQLKKDDLPYSHWDQQKSRIEALKKTLEVNGQVLSAEIASIIAIQNELGEKVTVHLLATDTILSVLAAELIKAWFDQKKFPNIQEVKFERPNSGLNRQKDSDHIIRNLRISDQAEYEQGVLHLLDVLKKISKESSILNITGGYKSIIPIITVWAQLEQLELMYIYNESEIDKKITPLSLPPLPINFDWEVAQCVTQYLSDKMLKAQDPRNPNFNESLDNKAFTMLKNWKLISADGCKTTSLAGLLKQFVEKGSMVSRDSVLGSMMEYKYYEYFNEYSSEYEKPTKGKDFGYYFWNDQVWSEDEMIAQFGFKKQEISYNIKNWNEEIAEKEGKIVKVGDFDLIFKRKNSEELAIGEVKAYGVFESSHKGKAWQRILAFQKKHQGKLPDAYILLLYNVKFQHEPSRDYNSDRSLLEKLKSIREFLGKKSTVPLRMLICDINLSSKSFKVHYDELLRHPIYPIEIKWNAWSPM